MPDGPAALAVALGSFASRDRFGGECGLVRIRHSGRAGSGRSSEPTSARGFTEEGKLPLETELAGVQVLLDGTPVALFYVSDRQINFAVPADLSGSFTTLVIQNAAGNSLPTRVPVIGIQPGVFFDAASGMGAILVAGTGPHDNGTARPLRANTWKSTRPVWARWCGRSNGLSETTSLVTVKIGNTFTQAAFAGLAPQFVGLYQVNRTGSSGCERVDDVAVAGRGQGRQRR